METNKNAKKARVLKALSIFMLIIMAMNFIMAYSYLKASTSSLNLSNSFPDECLATI